MGKLAIHGGEPVRTKPFPPKMLGAALTGEEELLELTDVIKEKTLFRHYGLGNPQKVNTFEREAREMLGSKFFLGLSSGGASLFCAAVALSIGVGDEVIMPSFGWFTDYYAVACNGGLPVLADIDDSLNLDPDDFKRKITKNTKAVIVVHYQGGPARMDEIMSIAKEHGIKVIEDCAQAYGGQYKGKRLGTIGDIGITSFQGNKLITSGEGGALWTDSEEYFTRAARYHDNGFVRDVFKDQLQNKALGDDEHSFAGCQFRMGELAGAVLIAQQRKLPFILERCRKGHKAIREHFKDNKNFKFRFVDEGDCGITCFVRFPTIEEAKAFTEALSKEGIPLGPSSGCDNLVEYFPIKNKKMMSDDLPPFGKGYNGEVVFYDKANSCPNTSDILSKNMAVPIGPLYSDDDVCDIIKAMEKVEKALY